MKKSTAESVKNVFTEDEVVLRESFYRDESAPVRPLAALGTDTKRRARPKQAKPEHYEIICISMYNEDLARLDEKVAALKQRGHRRMTRSALIRYALDRIALDEVPRSSL
jgi:hypothetical protein